MIGRSPPKTLSLPDHTDLDLHVDASFPRGLQSPRNIRLFERAWTFAQDTHSHNGPGAQWRGGVIHCLPSVHIVQAVAERLERGLAVSTVGEHGTALGLDSGRSRGQCRDAAALKGEGRGREGQGQRTDWASTLGVHTSTPNGKLKCGRPQA